jgi:hypothetical protein
VVESGADCPFLGPTSKHHLEEGPETKVSDLSLHPALIGQDGAGAEEGVDPLGAIQSGDQCLGSQTPIGQSEAVLGSLLAVLGGGGESLAERAIGADGLGHVIGGREVTTAREVGVRPDVLAHLGLGSRGQGSRLGGEGLVEEAPLEHLPGEQSVSRLEFDGVEPSCFLHGEHFVQSILSRNEPVVRHLGKGSGLSGIEKGGHSTQDGTGGGAGDGLGRDPVADVSWA